MSVYKNDKPEYFKECLNSLFSQLMCADIILGVDGEVSVDLENIIESYKNKYQFNFYLQRNDTNKGLAFTLNRLIDYGLDLGYKYFVRMDSDDICDPHRIRQQITFLENNDDIDVLGGGCEEFSSQNHNVTVKLLPTNDFDLKKNLLKKTPFIHPTVVFRHTVFDTGLRYSTANHLSEDINLWVDLAIKNFKFANLDTPILKFRFDESTFYRRGGLKKALSETKARLKGYKEINTIPRFHLFYVFLHFILRVLPVPIVKYLYKYMR